MWYRLWFAWAGINLLAIPAAWILALPCFVEMREGKSDNNHYIRTEPRLKKWLAWFDTPDNTLLGDFGFQKMYPNYSYWSRVQWLRRNSACGFDWSEFAGARINPTDKPLVDGDITVQDGPAGKEGRCYVTIGDYWNLVKVTRFGDTRCVKINIGWELKTYAEDNTRLTTQPIARYAMSIRFPIFIVG